jgi:hypothetical protein
MTEKPKRNKPAYYLVDFTTALPVADCRQRLERSAEQPSGWPGSALAPITQQIVLLKNDQFIIERTFPAAMHPIRLMGALDSDPDAGGGTWVHGAITHDTENQVLIEGLLVFVGFFLLTAIFFLRLKARGLMISIPALIVMLAIFSLRWRALRSATRDLALFLRRRLYLTEDQVKRGTHDAGSYATTDEQPRRHRHGSNGH